MIITTTMTTTTTMTMTIIMNITTTNTRWLKQSGRMPTSARAGVYSSALHDLNAIRDAPKVMAQMHATPANEAFRPLKDGGGPLVK